MCRQTMIVLGYLTVAWLSVSVLVATNRRPRFCISVTRGNPRRKDRHIRTLACAVHRSVLGGRINPKHL
jgi:hypothetical protein